MSEKAKRLRNAVYRITPTLKNHIVDKFDEMDEFKIFTSTAIDNERQSIEEHIDDTISGMDEEEREEFYEWGGTDGLFMVDDVFEKLSLNSFIIILYSYIESGMNTLCYSKLSDKRTEQRKKNKQAEDEGKEPEFEKLFDIKLSDMKDKGIRRAKRYLDKVFNVSFDSVSEQWNEVIGLGKLRNSIVHSNGIDEDEKIAKDGKLKQHIEDGRIEITGKSDLTHGQIIIKREYLDAILPIAKDFFKKLEV